MPLSAYFADPTNWAGRIHEPENFEQITAFTTAIGATKVQTTVLPYHGGPGTREPAVTVWHAPSQKRTLPPLLVLDDRDRAHGAAWGQVKSVNMRIQIEYNPVLEITHYARTYPEDLPWLGEFAAVLTSLGYHESVTAETLALLKHESGYISSDRLPLTLDTIRTNTHRPDQQLLQTLHTAATLASTPHIKQSLRRKYMLLDIPADLLSAMLKPGVPYEYAESLFAKRSRWQPADPDQA